MGTSALRVVAIAVLAAALAMAGGCKGEGDERLPARTGMVLAGESVPGTGTDPGYGIPATDTPQDPARDSGEGVSEVAGTVKVVLASGTDAAGAFGRFKFVIGFRETSPGTYDAYIDQFTSTSEAISGLSSIGRATPSTTRQQVGKGGNVIEGGIVLGSDPTEVPGTYGDVGSGGTSDGIDGN